MSYTPTPKRMSWGDMSRPPATTEAYREGMDRIFGSDAEDARKVKQDKLHKDAQIEKERIKKLLAS